MVAAATLPARRLRVANPLVLVVAGAILALLPGLPTVEVDPDLLLLVVLPPMLFWHAFIVTPREIKADIARIGVLSIAVVAGTAAVMAIVSHTVAGIPWAAATGRHPRAPTGNPR